MRDYLLSREHPVGRFKAAFFEALGYVAGEWQQLDSDLRGLAATGDMAVGSLHNPALNIAGPGQTWLSENLQGAVDAALSAAGHKGLRNLGKP